MVVTVHVSADHTTKYIQYKRESPCTRVRKVITSSISTNQTRGLVLDFKPSSK